MPTLRRILKYTPAAVLGPLVVAWVGSLFINVGFTAEPSTACVVRAGVAEGSFDFVVAERPSMMVFWGSGWWDITPKALLGEFEIYPANPKWWPFVLVTVPLVIMSTLLCPLAIGPFISFRFRLCQYLAYTALVAVELACYLRWQG